MVKASRSDAPGQSQAIIEKLRRTVAEDAEALSKSVGMRNL